jgi:hypothetical protein
MGISCSNLLEDGVVLEISNLREVELQVLDSILCFFARSLCFVNS